MTAFDLVGAEPARGILVTVKNAQALAAKEGGATGAIAATLVPQTIETVVLDKMVAQLRSSLKEKGVDAEVRVVTGDMKAASSGLGEGVALGTALCGAGWVAWRFGLSRFFR